MYVAASAAEGLSRWGVYRELPMAAAPMAKTTSFYRRNPLLDRVSLVRAKPSFSCFCALAGDDVFSVTSATQFDVDYLGQSTKGDLNVKSDHLDSFGLGGRSALEGPIEEVARAEAGEAEDLLRHLGIPGPFSSRYSPRGIFCSRTLNLRSISAIGYDMDYTLMHYNVMAWEGRAYEYCMDNLRNMGFPVDGLAFDPNLVIRGLVIDKEKGNLVKPDRFGYVKRAMHGTTMLSTRAVTYVLSFIIVIIHISELSILSKTRTVVCHIADMQSENHSFDKDASCMMSSEKGRHERMIQMLWPQRKRPRNHPFGFYFSPMC